MSMRHPLQEPADGERVVIIGTGEQAEIAFEYFANDSPHKVIGFSTEPMFVKGSTLHGLPVVPLDHLTEAWPPTEYRAFVAVSATHLNRLRRRLSNAVKAAGYSCVWYVSSHAFVWHNVEMGENSFVFENNVLQHGVASATEFSSSGGGPLGHRTVIEDGLLHYAHRRHLRFLPGGPLVIPGCE